METDKRGKVVEITLFKIYRDDWPVVIKPAEGDANWDMDRSSAYLLGVWVGVRAPVRCLEGERPLRTD